MEPSLPSEDTLLSTIGPSIPSNFYEGVTYHIGRRVGEGGMSIAYLALRVGPEGNAPVVVKVLRPRFVRRFGDTASLTVQKESVALGRLNERVPPTPFVLRLIEVGSVMVDTGTRWMELPWLAVEYVHGGAEGTTLADRVAHSIRQTRHAFDPARAAHAIECLCKGLAAVHEVGVIHRDLKPENVLCCGFGHDEIFKVADFGVARPSGVAATFGGTTIGTPGYAAPELIVMDQKHIGTSSDVFGLAAVIYFLLTGRPYFKGRTVTDAILEIQDSARSSVLDEITLSEELQERVAACRAIDQALARATSPNPLERPQTAEALAASLLPWLRADSRMLRTAPRRVESISSISSTGAQPSEASATPGWAWMTRQLADPDRVIRSVAWAADGRCLAATSGGLCFWNGTHWVDMPTDRLPNPQGIRFVHRMAAGRWLVGADDATFAIFTEEGTQEVVRLSHANLRVEAFSGSLDDLGIVVSLDETGVPTLHTLVGRRWLKPLPLPNVVSVTSMARVGDATWLLAGRKTGGGGIAALYSPLDWDLQPLESPDVRAYLACGGHPDNCVGVVAGADGIMLYIDETGTRVESVPERTDVSATVVDPSGTCWAAGAGRIWQRTRDELTGHHRWVLVWENPAWTAPFVSMFADIGLILAVTADGAIVEGRPADLELHTLVSAPPPTVG